MPFAPWIFSLLYAAISAYDLYDGHPGWACLWALVGLLMLPRRGV